jgi:hypothetical protein
MSATHIHCVGLVVGPEHWWWAGHLDDLQLPATRISGGLQDLHVAAGALVLQGRTAAAVAAAAGQSVFKTPSENDTAGYCFMWVVFEICKLVVAAGLLANFRK